MADATSDQLLTQAKAFCNDKRFDEALDVCRQLLGKNPTNIDALKLSANLNLWQFQDLDAALSYCAAILTINPYDADAFLFQGIALNKQKKYQAAKLSFELSLQYKPDNISTLSNYGLTLCQLNHREEALRHFDQALLMDQHHYESLINKAFTLLELHRYEEALDHYDKAFSIKAPFAEALSDRGNALMGLKRYEEALDNYAQALALNPDCATAHYSEAYCRLLIGDLLAGWEKYEYRWKIPKPFAQKRFKEHSWLGRESIDGKTILIYAEQGAGDVIQFSRYLPMLRALGANVYVEAYSNLAQLLTPLVGKDNFIARGQPLPKTDYHCSLLSLPLAFKTQLSSIPNTVPYLFATRHTTNDDYLTLPSSSQLRVGLVWQANTAHRNISFRSIPLSHLLNIISDDCSFVNLQIEISENDKLLLDQHPNIINKMDRVSSFNDTALLINQLDLVISVDTSVAHLAGALGKPVWILLCANADWRWLIDRKDSPWYPTATLFRQTTSGQWDDVINDVKIALTLFRSSPSNH